MSEENTRSSTTFDPGHPSGYEDQVIKRPIWFLQLDLPCLESIRRRYVARMRYGRHFLLASPQFWLSHLLGGNV
jgi:hypothetical protein